MLFLFFVPFILHFAFSISSLSTNDRIVIKTFDNLNWLCVGSGGKRALLESSELDCCIFTVERFTCQRDDILFSCYKFRITEGLDSGVTRECLASITPTNGTPRLGLQVCDNDNNQKWELILPNGNTNRLRNVRDFEYIAETPDDNVYEVNVEPYDEPTENAQRWNIQLRN